MELFHCITDPSEKMKTFNGECRSEAKPEGLKECRKLKKNKKKALILNEVDYFFLFIEKVK